MFHYPHLSGLLPDAELLGAEPLDGVEDLTVGAAVRITGLDHTNHRASSCVLKCDWSMWFCDVP